ncbi:MAG: RNA-binding protein, partial [Bacteroidetes bacterium]
MYNGGGVAILDYDRDGLQDIFFVSSQQACKLYRNKGHWQFEDVTERAGVAAAEGFKTGVTVVDIDADGWPDLYVCRTGLEPTAERDNLLFVNNGDGTFREEARQWGLADRSASNHANFFDYDGDGDLDCYVLNHPVNFAEVNKVTVRQTPTGYERLTQPQTPWDTDRLYRNDGNGTFTDVSRQAGIWNRAWGLSVTVSDFNRDGRPDIFVGNDYIEPDLLYINNGDGTFTNRLDDYFRHTSNHTMGVDIADCNNDGMPDLAALDMIAEDNRRQKLLMTTMLLDRYTSLVKFGYGHQLMRNTLQINTGGLFCETGTLSGISNTDWSWAILFGDYDNDSWKDLYITNGYRRDVTNLDYLNYTVDSLNRTGGLSPRRFRTFDDFLALIPAEAVSNYMFRNRGDLTFENVTQKWGLYRPSWSNGAAWADLDNDGDLDLVVNNIEMEAFLLQNHTAEKLPHHFLQLRLQGAPPNTQAIGAAAALYVGDQMQYQELTPVRGFFSSVQTLLHFGLGQATHVDRLELRWPDGTVEVWSDLPADTLLVLARGDGQPLAADAFMRFRKKRPTPLFRPARPDGLTFTHVENEFEDFDRQRLMTRKESLEGPRLAKADIDGDGLEDLFVGGAAGQPAAIFRQTPAGAFRQTQQPALDNDKVHEDVGAAFFDADGDGDMDLYVVSGGNAFAANSPLYQDRLYLNDGTGRFAKAGNALPRMGSSGSCVVPYDYDGDGDMDLFVGGRVLPGVWPEAPESYVLRNDGGRFALVTAEVAPELHRLGMVTAMAFGDLDGDGTDELVVTGEWMPVHVFRKEGGTWRLATESFGLSQTAGWWNSLALADLDGDGDLDIAAGNLGLNTRYPASRTHPLRLYVRDFDHNGQIDPILVWYLDDAWRPVALRDNLIKQMPAIKKKFPRYAAYAEADMYDLFPEREWQQATLLEAHTFATSVFVNEGGRFRQQPLPAPAQVAPVYDILVDDLNGDGWPDLVTAGNFIGSDVETGPLDASDGLVLLGSKAGFRPLMPDESGLRASMQARDLLWLATP